MASTLNTSVPGQGHTRTRSTEQRTSWSWKRLFGGLSHEHEHEHEHEHVEDMVTTTGDTGSAQDSPRLQTAFDDVRPSTAGAAGPGPMNDDDNTQRPGLAKRLSRKVVPGLPRTGTFKRQQSERRDRLEPDADQRRTLSVDRRGNNANQNRLRSSSSPTVTSARLSAPELEISDGLKALILADEEGTTIRATGERGAITSDAPAENGADARSTTSDTLDEEILDELDHKWMLNLSMHFRDKSKREKFFITYAETPTYWRRVTISLDYRDAAAGSLEEELQQTRYQRDKSARIYQAIRESIPEIQFFDTVTNLKLQTENERLHVNVVEDLAEIISYPSVSAIQHLDCPRIREDELVFDSHLSGFVYKVRVDGQVWIKKEIPGPDTIEEFLYEVNALNTLSGSHSVIQFGGVVLSASGTHVKGLLIAYAEHGALIDVIYDADGRLSWARREKWARQIVQGLSEIHEAGFVQGDFTLSNIVVDGNDDAKIIDINRRGCPVGWEPPEVKVLVESNQRLTMYIGVKSDLYQLGMVLYALATQQDEPEAHRPLDLRKLPGEVPDYYYEICRRCLSANPRTRTSASILLSMFPDDEFPRAGGRAGDGSSLPIIVDVQPANEAAYQVSFPASSHHRAFTSRSTSRTHTLTSSNEDDDESDYPPRGRSPPPPMYDAFPLPTTARETRYDDEGYLESEKAEKAVGDFKIVEDGAVEDVAVVDFPFSRETTQRSFVVENGDENENEDENAEAGVTLPNGRSNVFSFLDTDPSLPSSLPSPALSRKTSNISTNTTPKAVRNKTSHQQLRHILTERPHNIISPSPSQASLREKDGQGRKVSSAALAGPLASNPVFPLDPEERKNIPDDDDLHVSDVDIDEDHGDDDGDVFSAGTATNTPFTPYTPQMGGDGFEVPADAGKTGTDRDEVHNAPPTMMKSAARTGDLVGVGMHFDAPIVGHIRQADLGYGGGNGDGEAGPLQEERQKAMASASASASQRRRRRRRRTFRRGVIVVVVLNPTAQTCHQQPQS